MKIIKVETKSEGDQKAFELIKKTLDEGANVFGLATGSTPEGIYNKIAESKLDFSDAISINLDEYVGLDFSDEHSYHSYMEQHLFEKKPFKESYLPDGNAKDISQAIIEYDKIVDQFPVDIQILGIGQNGHIGFNEPGTSFESKTHLVDLKDSTIQANSRFFENIEEVPKQAISMGIASILRAKKILLVAYGKNKANAIKQAVQGNVSESIPASILQKHNDVVVIVDKDAASELK